MSPLVSGFATASLLAHLLLGCCWHHAHAQAADHPHPANQQTSYATGAAWDCQSYRSACCGQEHPGKPECGHRCVAWFPQPVRDLWMFVLDDHPAAVLRSLLEPLARSGPAVLACEAALPAPLGSIRTHLLFQVLLT